ncbi:hypothetical protein [Devosia sediminis]|uniref:Uncharacterized protein n=1 Tax=Devosia sediminis TaxID=2798801 RepID=A0A934IYU5_9HYPH|nr:hypothetical protein [Devosia sediminis]MBJ3785605.1 hypothetical protein [Devosia sediminis]
MKAIMKGLRYDTVSDEGPQLVHEAEALKILERDNAIEELGEFFELTGA